MDMKKLVVIIAAMMACAATAMQAKDVKGTVIYQSDGQPVVGVQIYVQGTEISTVTDVDGRFVLENLPEDVKKLQFVSIGLQTTTKRIPDEGEMLVKMKREERIVTPFAKAGIAITKAQGGESSATGTCIGYSAGVGVSFALSHYLSLTPAVMFSQKPTEWSADSGYDLVTGQPVSDGDYTSKTNPLYLTVPVMFDLKLWTKKSNKVILSVGPYVGFGLSGQYKVNGEDKGDLFGSSDEGEVQFKKFDAGIQIGIGGTIRHIFLGVTSSLGLTPISDVGLLDYYRNMSVEMSVGYYF